MTQAQHAAMIGLMSEEEREAMDLPEFVAQAGIAWSRTLADRDDELMTLRENEGIALQVASCLARLLVHAAHGDIETINVNMERILKEPPKTQIEKSLTLSVVHGFFKQASIEQGVDWTSPRRAESIKRLKERFGE